MRTIIPLELKCEYTVNPLGIDVVQPRFSWILESSQRGEMQTAYQILVASSEGKLKADDADKWDSKKVISDQSVNVAYKGRALASGEKCYWKVRVWDTNGKVSPYTKTATFEMGLLKSDDWEGKWIRGGNLFRNEFTFDKDIRKARAYICGLGYHELRINGRKVGDHVLDPGWTDYTKRILYVTYDITDYLKTGANAVGVMLGNGWYSPLKVTLKESPMTRRKYGNSPVLLLQMRIDFTDDSSMRVVSDDTTWKTIQDPIIRDDIYDGEIYDARLRKSGWDTSPYDDYRWDVAKIADSPGGELVSQASFPPIRVVKRMQPQRIINPEPGVYVYDFGQNFAGWVKLRITGTEGSKVTLRYAELLFNR